MTYIRNVDVMQHSGEWWMVVGAGTGAVALAPLSRDVTAYKPDEFSAVMDRAQEVQRQWLA